MAAALHCLQLHHYTHYVLVHKTSRRSMSYRTSSVHRYCTTTTTTTCATANAATSSDVTGHAFMRTEEEEEDDPMCNGKTQSKRREVLAQIASSLFCVPLVSNTPFALADDDASQELRLYLDDVNKFKILIPPDWQVGSGEGDGIRSLTAFYPQDPSANSNVSLVITGLGADFTRLESFGKVDAFAENLVGGLDRSWQRPPGVAAKLVDSKSANGLYYIEYTLQNPGETRKHLFSVLGIANNGWYNRLYTLTAQYVEDEAQKYGPTILKAVASFRLI